MTSWQLWRRIVRPPQASTLYQRMFQQSEGGIPWYVGCAEVFSFLLIFPLILFIGPVYSFGWVVGMSGEIARARDNGTLQLLALLPGGPLGASFAIATATMYREGAFNRINQRETWFGRIVVLILLAYVLMIGPRLVAGEAIVWQVLAVLILCAALVPDHIQSIALALAAAVVAAESNLQRNSVQWSAITLLSTLQVGAYGAAATTFLMLAPESGDSPRLVVATLVALLVLFLSREVLFTLLSRAIANRFGQATVLDLVNSGGV